MSSFFDMLKVVFDTFGAAIVVPFVIFIIALFLKVKPKKAFISALSAGVGLEGFNLIINAYSEIISPIMNQMVTESGINLPVFDMGWQAASIVAYSTEIGMVFIGLCIVLQLAMFALKFTNVFQASDLWNNYSYMIWGSMVYVITKNIWLSMGCMILLLLITTLCSELMAKRFATYYKYPNCTLSALHACVVVPYAIVMDWILNKLGMHKIKADPMSFQKRLGFLGEPMTLGLMLGIIIGIAGNFYRLNTIAAWGSIMTCGIATSAVMAIFPKIASIFAGAFAPLTAAAKKNMKNSDSEWYLSINDAAGYGEPATLISGLISMPIILVLAFILPGNMVLPVLSLTAIPYLIIGIVAISNGNMAKTIVSTVVYLIISLFICTITAPIFTQVATSVGVKLTAGAMMVTAFSLMGSPIVALIFFAFISKNPLFIALCVLVYLVCLVLFKKRKSSIVDYIERQATNPTGKVISSGE